MSWTNDRFTGCDRFVYRESRSISDEAEAHRRFIERERRDMEAMAEEDEQDAERFDGQS